MPESVFPALPAPVADHVRGRPTCEDVLEGQLNVAGIKGGGFDEGQVVIAWGLKMGESELQRQNQ